MGTGDKVFGSCKTDSFVLKDRPCIIQISYMYIYKDGADDWLPNSVEISGSGINPLLFIFKSSIPTNTWFGFDLRQYTFPPPPSVFPAPPPPSHPLVPPPEPIFSSPPPPPKPILPPPPPPPQPTPPSSSSKISGQKWGMVSVILGLLTALLWFCSSCSVCVVGRFCSGGWVIMFCWSFFPPFHHVVGSSV